MKWPKVALGELMASRASSVDPAKYPDERFELWSIPAFDEGAPESLLGAEIGSAKKIVAPNDILLSRIVPHIRRSWVVTEPAQQHRQIASGEWIIFRSERVHPAYLRHVLLGDTFHAQFMNTVAGVGGSLLRARPEGVARIKVMLPPLPEQQRIAAILDQADTLRRLRRQSLSRLNELGQSVFQEMFRDRTREWLEVELGSKIDFLTSGSRGWARYYTDEGASFIRIQNVKRGYFDHSDMAFVNAPKSAESRRTRVKSGDVLISITADLGRAAVVPDEIGEAYINQHLAIIRTDAFNPHFLVAALTSPKGQRSILKKDRSAVKSGMNFDDIRTLPIIFPPRVDQDEFAERLLQISKIECRYNFENEHLDALFASLQHRAFRGEL